MIPHITHQIWFQGWPELPYKYRNHIEKLETFNPNWEHMKWDADSLRSECEKFSPEALVKFDGFEKMIQKVDFGRYVVLHNYGGVSVDCDAECLRSFDKIPGVDRYDLILSKNPLNMIENKVTTYGLSKDLVIINNATLCCSKEHPIMKHFIEFLIENESWNDDVMLDTQIKTGPLILSIFFNKYLDDILVLDSDVFEPWGNINRRTILNHEYDQSWTHFGSVPIKIYRTVRNNLLLILLLIITIAVFSSFRNIAKQYKTQVL